MKHVLDKRYEKEKTQPVALLSVGSKVEVTPRCTLSQLQKKKKSSARLSLNHKVNGMYWWEDGNYANRRSTENWQRALCGFTL